MANKYLKVKPLDTTKFINKNDVKEIKNPVFFIKDNMPTPDGLLSNDIFGITKYDRAGANGYIDLGDWFMEPLFYLTWARMDNKIVSIVNGTKNYRIDDKGEFIEDPNGKTGIKFLKANMDKIKIRSTESSKRDMNIDFINKYKDLMFINKYPVIPAYYRDVNSGNGNYVGVGELNEMYSKLLISVRALKDSSDYGLTLSDSYRGRIQSIIQDIYNWLTGEPQLSKKMGALRRSIESKTADYSARYVISAPKLRTENIDDLDVDMNHALLPLACVCANFNLFVIFHTRRFFENEFAGKEFYEYIDKNGNLQKIKVKDYQIAFSDINIKKEMERYMFGFSNRFIPIEIPNDEGKHIYMRFKGYNVTPEEFKDIKPGTTPLVNRDLCWVDVFYMAALEAVKGKTVLITRFPNDSYFNQNPFEINISTTKETEPMFYNNVFIKKYPKIRQEDILKDTSNKFIDTVNFANPYLKGYSGDYDGDQVSVKGVYSEEANKELIEHINSKANYIGLDGQNIRLTSNEGIQSLFNLTKILDPSKLSSPEF